jgi:hypothetical protein
MANSNIIHRASRRAKSASRVVSRRVGWVFYALPEDAGARAKSASRQRPKSETQLVGAVRETKDGIQILFCPYSA